MVKWLAKRILIALLQEFVKLMDIATQRIHLVINQKLIKINAMS